MPLQLTRSWSTPELESLRATAVRFLETEMQPQDEAARQRGNVGHAIWRRAGELGLLCTDIPEEYGGGGGDFRHEAVIHEEMARRALSGMSNSVHSIVAHYLLNHGTEAQKRKYLPAMARGELVGAIAMTEPRRGLGPAGRAHARRTQGRPLPHQRQQDLHHQRPAGRPDPRGPARPTRPRARAAPPSSSWRPGTARAFAWAACSTRWA